VHAVEHKQREGDQRRHERKVECPRTECKEPAATRRERMFRRLKLGKGWHHPTRSKQSATIVEVCIGYIRTRRIAPTCPLIHAPLPGCCSRALQPRWHPTCAQHSRAHVWTHCCRAA